MVTVHLQVPNVNLDGVGLYQTAVSPTIHVAPAHLTLTVDSSHVASGSQVKFTAHRGDAKPVAVQSWVWTPGDSSPLGPAAADCAGGDSLCLTTLQNTTHADSTGVPQTGTMMAMAYLGTAAESASVSVTVDRPVSGGGGGCSAPGATRATASPPKSGVRTSSKTSGAPQILLSCGGGGGGTPSMVLTVTRDTLNPLYPRIRGESVNSVVVPERGPDTATVSVSLTQGGSPVPAGTHVTLRAEWLPSTGGHVHIKNVVRFESANAPVLTTGPEQAWPLFGYFCADRGCILKGKTATLLTNSSGTTSGYLVAGYLGGQARVIVSATIGGQAVEDTAIVGYAVSGLVSLQTRIPLSEVYWIGWNNDHAHLTNFYVQDSIALRLDTIARNMSTTVNGQLLYLQYNDASLPKGGAFTVTLSNQVKFEDPFIDQDMTNGGHTAHNTGLDQDVGLCYATYSGEDGGLLHRVYNQACSGGTGNKVDLRTLQNKACSQHAVAREHFNNHYHIRFVGSHDTAPGC